MKQPYGEGLASHSDPESCVVSQNHAQNNLTLCCFAYLYLLFCWSVPLA